MKQTIRAIAIQIETANQRMHHAIKSENKDLQNRMLVLLAQLKDQFYSEVRKEIGIETGDSVLLFCDLYPEGVVLSQDAYQLACAFMTREQIETHTAVPVASDMVIDLGDVLKTLNSRGIAS